MPNIRVLREEPTAPPIIEVAIYLIESEARDLARFFGNNSINYTAKILNLDKEADREEIERIHRVGTSLYYQFREEGLV